jgi:hypothetical protein
MAFAIFSVLELIYDKSVPRSFLFKMKKRGWYLILFAVLSVGFNYYKDCRSETKQKESDKAKAEVDSSLKAYQKELFQLQLSTKDSIIKTIESTYSSSIRASNEALAKYNLVITDSLHAVVSRIEINAVNPQLLISPITDGKRPVFVKNEGAKNILYLQFISKGGTSYNISLFYYIFTGFSRLGKVVLADKIDILKEGKLTQGEGFLTEGVTSSRSIELSSDIIEKGDVLVVINGTFSKDPLGEITIPYNEAFLFNLKENTSYSKIEFDFESVMKKINKKIY